MTCINIYYRFPFSNNKLRDNNELEPISAEFFRDLTLDFLMTEALPKWHAILTYF